MLASRVSKLPILEKTTLVLTYVLVFERDNLESKHSLFLITWYFLRNFSVGVTRKFYKTLLLVKAIEGNADQLKVCDLF